MNACVIRMISVVSTQQSVCAQKCNISRDKVEDGHDPGCVATTVDQDIAVPPG